jgi:hypothetical protein
LIIDEEHQKPTTTEGIVVEKPNMDKELPVEEVGIKHPSFQILPAPNSNFFSGSAILESLPSN